jgi:hypothetical protein
MPRPGLCAQQGRVRQHAFAEHAQTERSHPFAAADERAAPAARLIER